MLSIRCLWVEFFVLNVDLVAYKIVDLGEWEPFMVGFVTGQGYEDEKFFCGFQMLNCRYGLGFFVLNVDLVVYRIVICCSMRNEFALAQIESRYSHHFQ